MLLTGFYFFVALLLLIVVHEYGHFCVARLCGIKVVRFSFGFGKILARWHSKRGTEYVWSVFPLGGYVKMLDETEGEVPENERHLAFNNKPLLARVAVVVAGPLFNFLFAFCALWLMSVIGIKSFAPMIGAVNPQGIAARAGLGPQQEIIALNGKKIASWRDFQYALMPLIGSRETIALRVKSTITGTVATKMMPLADWQLDPQNPDVLASFGIEPFVPPIPAVLGEVVANAPAKIAGLKTGDVILTMENKPVKDWTDVVDFVRQNPGKPLSFTVRRGQQVRPISLTIGSMEQQGKTVGFIGVRSQQITLPVGWIRLQREGPLHALGSALDQTLELSGATFVLIGRLVTGKLGLKNLSGPVGLARGAGDSARSGFAYYLSFLAIVSISLGVLNLLPIPVLDGGHLLYYFIETVRRRPLSQEAKSIGMYLGLVVLVALMIIALTNDISRLTSS